MGMYRKKPVVVKAEVYREGMEDCWIVPWSTKWDSYVDTFKNKQAALDHIKLLKGREQEIEDLIIEDVVPCINTLEGRHHISPGDYIITGVKGERYPCKPDIFAMTYEPTEDGRCESC